MDFSGNSRPVTGSLHSVAAAATSSFDSQLPWPTFKVERLTRVEWFHDQSLRIYRDWPPSHAARALAENRHVATSRRTCS